MSTDPYTHTRDKINFIATTIPSLYITHPQRIAYIIIGNKEYGYRTCCTDLRKTSWPMVKGHRNQINYSNCIIP